jgi:hypothetical protein
MQQTIEALMPIFDAQFDSILQSRVKCMDNRSDEKESRVAPLIERRSVSGYTL